jgi:hypothetical protein
VDRDAFGLSYERRPTGIQSGAQFQRPAILTAFVWVIGDADSVGISVHLGLFESFPTNEGVDVLAPLPDDLGATSRLNGEHWGFDRYLVNMLDN